MKCTPEIKMDPSFVKDTIKRTLFENHEAGRRDARCLFGAATGATTVKWTWDKSFLRCRIKHNDEHHSLTRKTTF